MKKIMTPQMKTMIVPIATIAIIGTLLMVFPDLAHAVDTLGTRMNDGVGDDSKEAALGVRKVANFIGVALAAYGVFGIYKASGQQGSGDFGGPGASLACGALLLVLINFTNLITGTIVGTTATGAETIGVED